MAGPLIKWFHEISLADIALVGGKNASLGEMIKNLNSSLVRVPPGFALTTKAYELYASHNQIAQAIIDHLQGLDTSDLAMLKRVSASLKATIKGAQFDDATIALLKAHYDELRAGRRDLRVAVRSSASAEDLPEASFAGQQDTFLHVSSFDELLIRVQDVYASLFGERAIAYRAHNQIRHEDVLISVGIQAMVNSDYGVSGVMFSLDPESGFLDCIFINSSFGLGEAVVSGAVNPDEFMIYKPALAKDQLLVLNKRLGSKAKRLVYAQGHERSLKELAVSPADAESFSLAEDELLQLAQCARLIEDHYGRPMDIEWAKDGKTEELFILQARPETVHSNAKRSSLEIHSLEQSGTVLCEGRAVGKRIGQGRARVLKSLDDALDFLPGEILVADMTDPNWEPVMQKASAIVTDRGGRTCHAAIIARELGVAAVVGCHDATKKIADLANITVSCANGDTGQVFMGLLPIVKKQHLIKDQATPVPLMLIAANPSRAFSYHALPHQGIGLARLEFIIANSIGVHPNAILNIDRMPKEVAEEIRRRAQHFSSPVEFYVETLALGIASLAAVARPHPIIVRLSDFKSNEYEELIGGSHFEQKENNPMIGFRGAGRYVSPYFKEAFALECQALLRARNTYGFSNIEVMVPFVRTLSEAENVVAELERNGLKRGEAGLRLIMMCEVPSNVILAEEFLAHFDGFSIGSNDLTQLTLGVDRDSHLVAGQFSESDPAMLKMLAMAIEACKKQGKYVGICGQGPSDNITLARWLIRQGIDSISLAPDTIAEMHQALK